MKFNTIWEQLRGIPYISEKNASILYEHVIKTKPSHILELGFAHGVSSCVIAAALDENGLGHLTTVDFKDCTEWQSPSIEDLITKTDLPKELFTVKREKSGYNWFLHNEVKQQTKNNICEPKYDLCMIDGAKHWTTDGHAFFVADKLLYPGGWFLFDDYSWRYISSERNRNKKRSLADTMSEEEKRVPHIKEIIELLVLQHPNYSNVVIHSDLDWAWAQKDPKYRIKKVTIDYNDRYTDILVKYFYKTKKLLKKKVS